MRKNWGLTEQEIACLGPKLRPLGCQSRAGQVRTRVAERVHKSLIVPATAIPLMYKQI